MPEAKHAFTPPPGDLSPAKVTHHVATASPSRRALFAGAGALLAGAAISTAGGIADPAANADAELIALCAEFEALSVEASHVWDNCVGLGDGTQIAAEEALYKRRDALLPRMVALRASTPDGFYARARAMMHFGFGDSWDALFKHHTDLEEGGADGILLAAFMRDAMGRDVAPLFQEIEKVFTCEQPEIEQVFNEYGDPIPCLKTVRCPCDDPCQWVVRGRIYGPEKTVAAEDGRAAS